MPNSKFLISEFTKPRTLFCVALALVCAAGAYAFVPLESQSQRLTAAAFIAAILLWLTEAVPVALPAVIAPLVLVASGAITAQSAAESFLDPVVLLIFGGFILAAGVSYNCLDHTLAHSLLRRPSLTSTPQRILVTLTATGCFLSLVLSNSAVTAMLLPIGLRITESLKFSKNSDSYRTGVLQSLSWGSSIAIGLPIGTPPNLLAVTFLEKEGYPFTFLSWMRFAVPINLLLLLAVCGVLCLRYAGHKIEITHAPQIAKLQFTKTQRRVCYVVVLALLLWMVPDILPFAMTAPPKSLLNIFSPGNVGVFAAIIMVLLPAPQEAGGKRRQLLPLREAANINWQTLLLFGGGIALGKAATSTGLAKLVGQAFINSVGTADTFLLTACATLLAIVVSEISSNTAAAALAIPLTISTAQACNASPVLPTLGAALGASLGFMMPVSTPPNSIIYSTGFVTAREMMKAGIVLDIVGFIVVVGGLMLMFPGSW